MGFWVCILQQQVPLPYQKSVLKWRYFTKVICLMARASAVHRKKDQKLCWSQPHSMLNPDPYVYLLTKHPEDLHYLFVEEPERDYTYIISGTITLQSRHKELWFSLHISENKHFTKRFNSLCQATWAVLTFCIAPWKACFIFLHDSDRSLVSWFAKAASWRSMFPWSLKKVLKQCVSSSEILLGSIWNKLFRQYICMAF